MLGASIRIFFRIGIDFLILVVSVCVCECVCLFAFLVRDTGCCLKDMVSLRGSGRQGLKAFVLSLISDCTVYHSNCVYYYFLVAPACEGARFVRHQDLMMLDFRRYIV